MTPQSDLTDHDMLIRIDTTVTAMNKKFSLLCAKVEHEEEARGELDKRVTRLEERLSIWQIGQAAWTTLASALAAAFGRSN